MKSHIGPNGPDRCRAKTPEGCPFAKVEDHFPTKAAAQEEYTRRLEEAYDLLQVSESKNKELSEYDDRLRNNNKNLAQNIVALRAQLSGISFEDANPVRAERRLKEAIEFANERNNSNLMDRLTQAVVLPSGAFRLEDKTRFSTDKALKSYVVNKFLETERKIILDSIVESTKTHRPSMSNFAYTSENGRYELNFKKEIDEDYLSRLPSKLQNSIMSEREVYSIEKAREILDEETFRSVTTERQHLDFVVGNLPDVGQKELNVNRELTGATGDERVKSGILNLVGMYEQARVKWGTPGERKTELNDYKNSMKIAAVSTNEEHVFLPARSQKNGGIVSSKPVLNKGELEKRLSKEKLTKLTVIKKELDREKARLLLNDEQYGKLFGNVKAYFKVVQSPSS